MPSAKEDQKRELLSHRWLLNFTQNFDIRQTCPICGKVYYFHFARHMDTHKKDLVKNYLCDICGTGTSIKSRLLRHMKEHRQKRMNCKSCGFTTKCEKSLRTHIIGRHTSNMTCVECNREYKSEASLWDHMRRHQYEKDFQCPDCGKCFYYDFHLRRGNFEVFKI